MPGNASDIVHALCAIDHVNILGDVGESYNRGLWLSGFLFWIGFSSKAFLKRIDFDCIGFIQPMTVLSTTFL